MRPPPFKRKPRRGCIKVLLLAVSRAETNNKERSYNAAAEIVSLANRAREGREHGDRPVR